MRLPAAFLFCILTCLFWTACNDDECGDVVDCNWLPNTIDCSTINTYDSTTCILVSNADSAAYVNTYLGSWHLAAIQNSGFGGGSTDCTNYSEALSPISFTLNADYTWHYISTDPPVDTMLTWSAVSGFAGWGLLSSDTRYPIPQPRSKCYDYLVRDDRPVDGPLLIYAQSF